MNILGGSYVSIISESQRVKNGFIMEIYQHNCMTVC